MIKIHRKYLVISLITALVIIILILTVIFGLKKSSRKSDLINVGFYNIGAAQEKAFTELLTEISKSENQKIYFYTFNSETAIKDQIQKNHINLILAADGYALENSLPFVKNDVDIPYTFTSGMYSSMREAVVTSDGKIKALPLLFDNLEIDINISEFKMSGLERIATWKDIEQLARKIHTEEYAPISFAGADSVFLLDFIGAMGEALEGVDAYNKTAEILKKSVSNGVESDSFDAEELYNQLFIVPDAPLPYTFYYLKQLVEKGLISKASREFVQQDINSMANYRKTDIFITTLSAHRTFEGRSLSAFSSIYVPSNRTPDQRAFTATTTYAVPLVSNEKTSFIVEKLIAPEVQESLCRTTGLAPVLSNSRVPDKQSDDARYWIASTTKPLAGLGHEASFTSAQLKQLSSVILDKLFF